MVYHLLGDIVNHEMVLNDAGRMVTTWHELPQRFSNIELIEYVIIAIVGVPLEGTLKTVGDSPKQADTRPAPTAGLGDIIGASNRSPRTNIQRV